MTFAWFYSAKPAGVLREAANNKDYVRFGEADSQALEAAFQQHRETLLPIWHADAADPALASAGSGAKTPLPPAGEPLAPTTVVVRCGGTRPN